VTAIGVYDAKTQQVLERVRRGEQFVITKQGRTSKRSFDKCGSGKGAKGRRLGRGQRSATCGKRAGSSNRAGVMGVKEPS
jgi:hypothetical protein